MICAECGHELVANAVFCPLCGHAVDGARECDDYVYEAFVSYRHRPADRNVAMRLQRFLEGFKIPSNLETDHPRGKIGKLFRDEDELPTSSSLTAQIEDALRHARCLIVVCSPESKGSLWVQREVELFASLHDRSRIFLALVEGEPEDSFPPLLLKRLAKTPEGDVQELDVEPLAADFRTASGKKFKAEAERITAALIGCSYDALRQRQRLRFMKRIALATTLAAVLAIAFGAFSFHQQRQIEANHFTALRHESELLASEAEELLSNGDRYQALQVALSALPQDLDSDSRPFVPAASLALYRAIGLYPTLGEWSPLHSFAISTDANFSANERDLIAVSTADENVEVREAYFGSVVYTVQKQDLLASVGADGLDFGGKALHKKYLTCLYGNYVFCLNVADGTVAWSASGEGQALAVSLGESYACVMYASQTPFGETAQGQLVLYNLEDGTVARSFDVGNVDYRDGLVAQPDDEGSVVAFRTTDDDDLHVADLTGEVHTVRIAGAAVEDVRFEGDRIYVLSNDTMGFGPMYVEAFDRALNRLWRYDGYADLAYNSAGFIDASNNEIVGIDSEEGDGGCLIVTLSTTVVGLDLATGAEIGQVSFNKPILDCYCNMGIAFGVLTDGTVFGQAGFFHNDGFILEKVTNRDLAQAEFVVCPGVGMLLVSRSTSPGRVIVSCMGDTVMSDMSRTDLEHIAEGSAVFVDRERACASNSEGLMFLGKSLEQGQTLASATMPLLDWSKQVNVSFSESGTAYAWGRARESGSALAIYRINSEGMPEQSRIVEQAFPDGESKQRDPNAERARWTFVGPGRIGWRAPDRVELMDAEDLSTRSQVKASSESALDDVCYGTDTVILLEHGASDSLGRFRLVRISDGVELASQLDDYSFPAPRKRFSDMHTGFFRLFVAKGFATAVSADASRAALACSDGRTRTFSLEDGSLIWESSEIAPQPQALAFVPESGNLLVQDAEGRCSLASGADGSLLAATMTTLPALDACVWAERTNLLMSYREAGVAGKTGVVLISADDALFGPIVDVPKSIALAPDGNSFVIDDNGKFALYIVYDVDAVRDIATKLVEGHELSEAEAAYYQTGTS